MSFGRVLGAWVAICMLMIANGAFRELWLAQAIGRTWADIASATIGAGIILLMTRRLFAPLAGGANAELLRVSVVMVGLTLVFEFTFGHWVDHKSWSDLLANYAVWRGRLWPLVLTVLALTPWIWGRWAPRAA